MSEIRVDNITDEAGTGKPGFPNGITATGAALTDPEITGGIYLGGTGSANYLEDYEEGTWTLTQRSSSNCNLVNVENSYYTRVGRLVNITARFTLDITNSSGEVRLNFDLPFTAGFSNQWGDAGIAQVFAGSGSSRSGVGAVVNPTRGTTTAAIYWSENQVNTNDSEADAKFSLLYVAS